MASSADIRAQIKLYISNQPEKKRSDMQELHRIIQRAMPRCRLWFLDGRNAQGKVVSNPNIGYGLQTTRYADGSSREFYQVGMSANTSGISLYFMGVKDRKYLARTLGGRLGKASVTGYCIKFRTLGDIDVGVLEAGILRALEASR